jgi:hypothetical protein
MELAERLRTDPGSVVALAEHHVETAREHVNLAEIPFHRAGRYRVYPPFELAAAQRSAAGNAIAGIR